MRRISIISIEIEKKLKQKLQDKNFLSGHLEQETLIIFF